MTHVLRHVTSHERSRVRDRDVTPMCRERSRIRYRDTPNGDVSHRRDAVMLHRDLSHQDMSRRDLSHQDMSRYDVSLLITVTCHIITCHVSRVHVGIMRHTRQTCAHLTTTFITYTKFFPIQLAPFTCCLSQLAPTKCLHLTARSIELFP